MKNLLIFVATLIISRNSWAGADLQYRTQCDSVNKQATISFVGDILIHEALYEAVVADTKHFTQLWSKAIPLFEKASFSVGNLEGPSAMGIDEKGKDHGDVGFIYDNFIYAGTNFKFNYHPRILQDLKSSGFDLITLANNHAYDRYSIGIDRTIEAAKAINFPTVGTLTSKEETGSFYTVADINGIHVAFLGCTESSNIDPPGNKQILFCYDNPERIISIIKEANGRADVDAVVVMPHWGVEYSPTPQSSQKEFARKYIDAGAIAVIGSHPHVLEPWEKYISKDGREAFIIYSLGNFVAGQAGLERKTGTVAYMGITKQLNQKAKIFGVAYTPTYRGDLTVLPIGSNNSKDILNHVATMYGTKRRLEPSAPLMPLLCTKDLL